MYFTKTPRVVEGAVSGVPVPVPVGSGVVPPTQLVDPQGFVTVICQPAPGAAGYSFRARPGKTVTCNNGATPSF